MTTILSSYKALFVFDRPAVFDPQAQEGETFVAQIVAKFAVAGNNEDKALCLFGEGLSKP